MKTEAEIRAALTVYRRGLEAAITARDLIKDMRSVPYREARATVAHLRLKVQVLEWVVGEGPNKDRLGP